MGNPQTNALKNGAKATNNHLSGRFAGVSNVNTNQYEEHPSTLHGQVDMVTQHKVKNKDPLPQLTNNKFVKQNVVVSNTDINSSTRVAGSDYINDPRVMANLQEKKDVNQLIDMKTLMVLALIVMVFIFILPFIYDALN